MSDCTRTSPCLPDHMIPPPTIDPLPWIVAALVLTIAFALIIRSTNR